MKYKPEKIFVDDNVIPYEYKGTRLTEDRRQILWLMYHTIPVSLAYQIVKGRNVSSVAKSNTRRIFKNLISEDETFRKGYFKGLHHACKRVEDMDDRDLISFLRWGADYIEPKIRHTETKVTHEVHPVRLEAFETKKVSKQLEDGNTVDAEYEEIQEDTA